MADTRWLDLLEPLCAESCDGHAGDVSLVQHLAVTPETLWRAVVGGFAEPNDFWYRAAALAARSGKPVVGHGVGYSPGTAEPMDEQRRARWRGRLAADRQAFAFRWYTEHLGASWLGGENLTLPLPLPQDAHVAALVRERLLELRIAAPRVGIENSAFYYTLGDPLEEPAFLADCIDHPELFLLLDLHNLHTNALNLGFDPHAWLDRCDLGKVEEIHVSGGAWSDPAWLEDGAMLRLDSHDCAVPEPVWELLTRVVPRCPALRAVTLERMEGTVGPSDVPALRAELRRIHGILRQVPR
ncbi:MAG: DUF692 family protein [Planctomycetes bacterium]|nr:DUF692 family protein [Planctomycetota bacterium]